MSNIPEPSENPYAAPEPSVADSADGVLLSHELGMVNQVTVVGILQIVLGVMELLMAGMLIFYAFFFSYMFSEIQAQGSGDPPPAAVIIGMQVYFGLTGGLVFIFSIMRIVAGISSFWFKGRLWMLISLIGGMVSCFTFYCAPFSIGLAIYGLVVLFNAGVVKAFKMGAEGVPPEEIKHRFMAAAFGTN